MNHRAFIRAISWVVVLVLMTAACKNQTPAATPTVLNSPLQSPPSQTPTAIAATISTAATVPATATTSGVVTTTLGISVSGKLAFATDDTSGVYRIASVDLSNGVLKTLTTPKDPGDAEPTWSADGKHIVFISGRNRGANFEIYSMDADGSKQTALISTPNGAVGGNYSPMLSPDGKKITFHTNRDGNMEIYIANADGSDAKNITNNPANDAAASWSPDGSQIAFSSDRAGNYNIYIMNSDGSNVRPTYVNTQTFNFRPRFSPNGKLLLFSVQSMTGNTSQLAVVSVDGSNFRMITKGPGLFAQGTWIGDNVIVYVGRFSETDKWQLYRINVDGTDGRPIVLDPNANYRNPAFTPR